MHMDKILSLTLAGVMTAGLFTGCPWQQGGAASSASSSSSSSSSRPHYDSSDDDSDSDTSSSSSSSEPETDIPEGGYKVVEGTYHVYNADGLKAWAAEAGTEPSTNCTLEADITLTGEWTPVGNFNTGEPYTGTFDGQGHTIEGLHVALDKDDSSTDAGLFAYIKGGCVKNLRLEAPSISGYLAGGIAAVIDGGEITGCTVTNATIEAGGMTAGGIAGTVMANSTIEGCVVSGSTISGGEYIPAGGLVGTVQGVNNTFVACCVVKGTITANPCGGMFGCINWVDKTTVTACYWSGDGDTEKGVGQATQGSTAKPNWEDSADIHKVDNETTWDAAVEEMNEALTGSCYSYSYEGGTVELHIPGAGVQNIALTNPLARFLFEDLGL